MSPSGKRSRSPGFVPPELTIAPASRARRKSWFRRKWNLVREDMRFWWSVGPSALAIFVVIVLYLSRPVWWWMLASRSGH
jgi:hypothetical protein